MILFILLGSQQVYCQKRITAHLTGGYGTVEMKDPNSDMKSLYIYLKQRSLYPRDVKNVSGRGMYSAEITYSPNKLSYGVMIQGLSGDGDVGRTDEVASYEETYTVQTTELSAIVRYTHPIKKTVATYFQIGAGYGFASGKHKLDFVDYSHPEYASHIDDDLTGEYFVSHLQGGVEFVFSRVRLGLSCGYRLANAGALSGPHRENGINYGSQTFKNAIGNDINFDYSGVTFGATISYDILL